MTSLVSVTNMTISNAGKTAVAASAAFALARTDVPLKGKVYFEVTINTFAGGGSFGFLNATETVYICSTTNSHGVVQNGVYSNNGYAYLGNAASGMAAAQVWCFAYDEVLVKWWARLNNGPWNEFLASPDPATGTNGFDPSSSGGPWYAGHSGDGSNFQVTFNFGQSAFTYAIPAGFSPVDRRPVAFRQNNVNLLR